MKRSRLTAEQQMIVVRWLVATAGYSREDARAEVVRGMWDDQFPEAKKDSKECAS